MDLTKNEEDYLKALFHLTAASDDDKAGTNQLADYLNVSPASVHGMLKKLKAKTLVSYKKYGKVELTGPGRLHAISLIRKHRLWETFLYEKMNFAWDEVHDVAEQLEHIRSAKLVAELDKFLGYPSHDPHGDVIPDAEGNYQVVPKKTLREVPVGTTCRIVAVRDTSVAFLKYVTRLGLELSSKMTVVDIQEFDDSLTIEFDGNHVSVSAKFAENVFVVLE